MYVPAASLRVVKVTRPNRPGYGLMPVVVAGRFGRSEVDLRPCTVWEYFERLRLHNDWFADDIRYAGVIPQANGSWGFVTSQPAIEGAVGASRPAAIDIERYFRARGFQPVAGHEGKTYYRPSDNAAVFDAHAGNLVCTVGGLLPIDLVTVHPDDQLLRVLEEGLGAG